MHDPRLCRPCNRAARKGGEHREHGCHRYIAGANLMWSCGCVCVEKMLAAIVAFDDWPPT